MAIRRDKNGRRCFRIGRRWYRWNREALSAHLPKNGRDWIMAFFGLAIAAFYGFVFLFWPLLPYLQEAFRG